MTGTASSEKEPPAYAEFGVMSNFSFLRGASKPEHLVVTGHLLGYRAMGIADCNTVAGVVRGWSQAKVDKVTYHPGCRLVFADGLPDMLAYPQDRKGWGHLCRMLTAANQRGEKGAPRLLKDDLFEWGENLSLAVLPRLGKTVEAEADLIGALKRRFGSVWLAVAPSYGGNDSFRFAAASAMAQRVGVPMMATNDVLYHLPEQRNLQDVLTAIRLKTTVDKAGLQLAANAERHMKLPLEMTRLFRRYPEAIAETQHFASTLSFSLKDLHYNYPEEPTESGLEPQAELERLVWQGAERRYPEGVKPRIKDLICKELGIVETLKYARYFLTVHEIVSFARSKKILCQGRGSAANSVICYCLGITDVGPDIVDVLFERFISAERDEPPDIDVDFEHERRHEVMTYIYEKYSTKRTALAAAVISYRGRSALREVAKAMGLSEDVMNALSGSIWGWSTSELGDKETGAAGLDQADPVTKHVVDLSNAIMGFPRHLSQHVGGFVITKDRLDEIVPIVKTAMDDRMMVEWDKDDLDAVKILKVDILALGMLTCLQKAFGLVQSHYGARNKDNGRLIVDLDTLPKEDARVYDMICRADTMGVFQIESRAQMSMLPRLKPREFYDLVIEVAIVRPGPIQGDMVHPYLRRRQKKEKPDYAHPELEKILSRTLGVPLFQEQAMRIAIEAGGFTPGEADELRRAMATFKRTGTIGNYEKRMIDGMVRKGYDEEFAKRCFNQIKGFGEYGFPESHAAAFALLVYASCWFKTFYPDVFCAAILNSQPMGFYRPAQLIRDAQDHGVEIRAVDVNHSDWDCLLEDAVFDPRKIRCKHEEMRGVIQTRRAVRLGFREIKGLSEHAMKLLVAQRGQGYISVRDLWLRSGLDASDIERLADADAFRSMGLDRREALWAVRALDAKSAAESLPLFESPQQPLRDNEQPVALPAMPLGEHVVQDYRFFGHSLKAHPLSFFRSRLNREGVTANTRLGDLRSGRRVSVAGLVLVRQRPGSAKGVIFMTLEDEETVANVIVWKKVFEQYRPVVLGARFVRVTGKLQSASDVIHVVADRIEDITPWLAELSEEAQLQLFEAEKAVRESGRRLGEWQDTDAARQALPQMAQPGHDLLARRARNVMPKGRNFQ
ncbi:error-prone DNA polymerase [Oryzicola mucosus]|uniref:Error-prone DNA polymerase n=1 Tax=Oryzicola mucosus TaxID=2767425 RepID=A0A8J6PM37_9HYPH|nr:error-prone DNA polymerase [Oryzicola mucosus]MBD0414082.1 error-prone DNA polymerase [Oryzicola mucosus]